MMHPHTELKPVNPLIGQGVFATRPIPRGTIVYTRDELEIIVPDDSPLRRDPRYAPVISKYAYIASDGSHILSWDHGRYVNHACDANSMSTGYGFEIAVRDIQPGEQVTDDYGLFNLDQSFDCACGSDHCRGRITAHDIERHRERYDRTTGQALLDGSAVDQPLWDYLDTTTQRAVRAFMAGRVPLRSVSHLKHTPAAIPLPGPRPVRRRSRVAV